MKKSLQFLILLAAVIFAAVPSALKAQTIIKSAGDNFIQGGNFADAVNTTDSLMRVRGATAADNIRKTYIKFDLTSYKGTITKAVLRIWCDRAVNSTTGNIDRSDFFKVKDDSWKATELTWNKAPLPGEYLFSQEFRRRATADPDTMYEWDVTAYVKTEYAGDKVVSFHMADTTNNGTDLRLFSGRGLAGLGPTLAITGTTDVKPVDNIMPQSFEVSQNYPNPFNPSTQISYAIPSSGFVNISVYDVKGEKVATLYNGMQMKGAYQLSWNASDDNGTQVPSGIYFARITYGAQSKTVKMMLMR